VLPSGVWVVVDVLDHSDYQLIRLLVD